jgi:hypothetical protein
MKKILFLLAATVMVSIITASVLSPAKQSSEKDSTTLTTTTIPDDVQLILNKSCMDCHANGGSHMAMSMLNFSEWDNYKPGKQAKKAGAICYMISKEKMPPKSFRKNNPDAILTQAQKDLICKWSETLNQNK